MIHAKVWTFFDISRINYEDETKSSWHFVWSKFYFKNPLFLNEVSWELYKFLPAFFQLLGTFQIIGFVELFKLSIYLSKDFTFVAKSLSLVKFPNFLCRKFATGSSFSLRVMNLNYIALIPKNLFPCLCWLTESIWPSLAPIRLENNSVASDSVLWS